ncbi:MAG: acyl-CoA dehydratase activase [Spirochaetes bacterium]|nr:acyl-CoA dehydratase activase [Spirochaetota bacterium]
MEPLPVLGVDIGSVSVSCALLDASGAVLASGHRVHQGKVRETLAAAVADLSPGRVAGIGITGSGQRLLPVARTVDPLVALVVACRRLFPAVGSILSIGGERFSLVRFDAAGGYVSTRSNSSCAAGTGSFLDQQARRLALASSRELAEAALANTGDAPRISTRCAVFARTDLVHAQQAGHSLEEICDGLCAGLARNVADTLLAGEPPRAPVIFAGGVAANEAVRRHLERLFGVPVLAHALSPVLGAIGAALDFLDAPAGQSPPLDLGLGIGPLLSEERGKRRTFYGPLDPGLADHPSSDGVRRFVHGTGRFSRQHPVEVEVFREPVPDADGARIPVWLGIDVGSTSTKAVLAGRDGVPIVGFYTRTLGRPVTAAQALLEAAAEVAAGAAVPWQVLGTASTGAGRKFVGRIIGADLVLDEISAHARAAVELDPSVDTIIEIGGQDAKFTTLREGRVTFAHMNTVCAAGTGSFLEEQAGRLGVDLAAYAGRVAGVRAPLASDRCAVFMERDINDLLSLGFSVDEILAASLFAVRENYLQKVARGAVMGSRICFQGATAKNRALVAAFEQGLGKPVFVSEYCHLTGALGAALALRDRDGAGAGVTAFRGFDAVLAREVPIRAETCGLCANHCRLCIAEVAGETVAFGFLCGRDYNTHRYVNANRSGFDLAAERRRAFEAEGMLPASAAARPGMPTLGLPAALGLVAEMPLWRRFFAELGVPVVTSEDCGDATALGRDVEGAEFCAPISALHGHAARLAGRVDWLFLPVRLEEQRPGEDTRRLCCYYTQFGPALVSALECVKGRVLAPYADWTVHRERTLRELAAALGTAGIEVAERRVADALDRSIAGNQRALERLERRFQEEMADAREPRVVLIGRPYTVLSPEMNKGIPAIFGTLGVKTFFQDMVPHGGSAELGPLLGAFHWQHAVEALEAALAAARTPMLYPVYVTAFKCSPDSFALDAFRRILDAHGKPYLVLQLDDHDSSMGYESRIEAGVRAFRNHAERAARRAGPAQPRRALRAPPRAGEAIAGRTLLLPDFDPIAGPLVAANLRREGVDARLLHEDEMSIRAAMRHNTGQCIPLNAIVQAAVETIRLEDLDPSRTLVWMSSSTLPCNLPLFPQQMEYLFETFGGGMEQVRVYVGDLSFIELSARAALSTGRAYLFAGFVRRVACRLRPYETEPGATDQAVAEAVTLLAAAFADGGRKEPALKRAMRLFDRVPVAPGRRPKVAIFGDLYVRDNDVFNQGLVRAIEEAGGEAVVTPPADFARIVVGEQRRRWRLEGMYEPLLVFGNLVRLLDRMARRHHRHVARFLGPYRPVRMSGAAEFLARFGVRTEHSGESVENLLKIYHLTREHPDLRLFVQASPAFCCPSLVTEAMARDIQRVTGVPVVSLTYDGTGRYQNDAIVPYLRFSRALDA